MTLGVVMGISLVFPTTFLPTYTKELGIPRISYFFIVYASTRIHGPAQARVAFRKNGGRCAR